MSNQHLVQYTAEYCSMKRQQDQEREALLSGRNTKKQRHKLATKHVKEFTELTHKWAASEALKVT